MLILNQSSFRPVNITLTHLMVFLSIQKNPRLNFLKPDLPHLFNFSPYRFLLLSIKVISVPLVTPSLPQVRRREGSPFPTKEGLSVLGEPFVGTVLI